MAVGLFMIMLPNEQVFLVGLATIIVGNGLFKPNISSMVGQLYAQGDSRRDRGFTLFYMGINGGALIAPLLTGWLASHFTDTPMQQNYKLVFGASGVGMLISLAWFWFGRRQLQGVGRPAPDQANRMRVVYVLLGMLVAIPVFYLLMAKAGAVVLQWLLTALFVGVGVMLVIEAVRTGRVQVHRVIAMLIIFAFNVLFWMFFEQAGSSFNFLAQNIVEPQHVRRLGIPGGLVPVGESGGHRGVGADRVAGLGLPRQATHGAVHSAQIRPGPARQRVGLRGADVCAGRAWSAAMA